MLQQQRHAALQEAQLPQRNSASSMHITHLNMSQK